jgi:tRNA A-37 threonylcarbamoyl transferase component Bud32
MIIESDTMHIDAPYRAMLTETGLTSVPAVLSCMGDRLVAWSRSTDTIYTALPRSKSAIYVKRFHFPRWGVRLRSALRGTLLGGIRAKNEYRVLTLMRRLGIQAVRPIAYGVRRRYGFVSRSFLITEAVPESMALSTFIQRYGGTPGVGQSATVIKLRRRILVQLARQIRHMHDAGFVHRDLFWRNVLIRPLPNQQFEFYFLDVSVGRRIRVRQWRQEAIVRDLAAMGVMAPAFCSRADQLRFIRAYLQINRIDDEARRWMELVQQRAAGMRALEHRRMSQQIVFERISQRPITTP